MKKLGRVLVLLLVFVATLAAQQQSERDRGIELYRDGKFSEAIEVLKKVVEENRDDRWASHYLGGAYFHTGDKKNAITALSRRSSGRPPSAPGHERSVKILHNPKANYTDAARRSRSNGEVIVAVEFRADGKIGFALALPNSMHPDLIHAAIESAKRIEFEPAIKDEKPVTTISFVAYGFSIY